VITEKPLPIEQLRRYVARSALADQGVQRNAAAQVVTSRGASTDAPGGGLRAGIAALGYWRVIALTASNTAVWRNASVTLPGGPG
jgi:tRNA(Ile2) C34 agmatinyltransferase TiaS